MDYEAEALAFQAAVQRRIAGDQRVLDDIERMEKFMAAPSRGWQRCAGCSKLRSTTDTDGICDQCRPAVEAGTLILVPDVEPEPPALPDAVAPQVVLDAPLPPPEVEMPLPPADPKQKPVKRQWWKRSR